MPLEYSFLNTKPFRAFNSRKAYPALRQTVKTIAVYKGGGGLGDLAAALPFFKTIRAAFPEAKILYLGIIYPRFEKIFKAIPYFDGYIRFERPDKGRGIKKFLRFRKEWKGKIDLLIDTQRRWETSFWLRCLNAKHMLSASFLLSGWPMPALPYKKMHILEQLMSLPARLGFQEFEFNDVKITIPKESLLKAAQFLRTFPGNKFIALFPGCGMDFKNWPPEHFAKLGDLFGENGYRVLLLGSPKDTEIMRAVAKKMRSPAVIPLEIDRNLTAEILDEAAILEHCRAVIGSDSGSLHLAAGMGCLSAAIFGPTTPRKFSPISRRTIVFYKNFPCSPCRFKCRRAIARECLTAVTPEEIFSEVGRYLSETPGG